MFSGGEESPSDSNRNSYVESHQRSRSVDSLDNNAPVVNEDNDSRPNSRRSSQSNRNSGEASQDCVPELLDPNSRPESRIRKSVSPAKRAESFKIATELHRVDSVVMEGMMRRKYQGRASPLRTSSSSTDADALDDGYVSVVFSESGFQLDTSKDNNTRSPYSNVDFTPPKLEIVDWESEYGDYVELPACSQGSRSQEQTNDNNNNRGQDDSPGMRSVATQCRSNNNRLDNRRPLENGANRSAINTGAKTSANRSRQVASLSSVDIYPKWDFKESPTVIQNRVSAKMLESENSEEYVYDNVQTIHYDNVIFNHSAVQQRSQNYAPEYDNTPLRSMPVKCQDQPGAATASQVSLPKSPMLVSQSKLPGVATESISSKTTSRSSSVDEDPWIPMTSRSQVASNLNLVKKNSTLRKSSSLSSLCDSREDVLSQKWKSHKRQPSDTLVFSNRNAYVATNCPRNIKLDPKTQRTIARLATPPRDLGPSDILDDIKMSREYGRVVTRYATPPRVVMDPANMYAQDSTAMQHSISNDLDLDVGSQGQVAKSSCSPRRNMSASVLSSPRMSTDSETELWNDLECFMQGRSQLTAPLARPESLCSIEPQSSANSSAVQSPTSPSPSSQSPGDGIMDSLKHAVSNFTSRITGKGTRSLESSPIRSPRTRSVGAIEDLRLDQLAAQDQQKNSARDFKKRHRFVYQLARAYSDRIKNKNRPGRTSDSSMLAKQLASLLKENKPGSSMIGARIATNKPIVLGTYTLQRHRPARPYSESDQDGQSCIETVTVETPTSTQSTLTTSTSAMVTMTSTTPTVACSMTTSVTTSDQTDTVFYNALTDSNTASAIAQVTRRPSKDDRISVDGAHDSGVLDLAVRDLNLDEDTSEELIDAGVAACMDGSAKDDQNSTDSNDETYYYERRFVEDLEGSLMTEEFFRDSAVYSDDGVVVTEMETLPTLTVSIRETVRMIENRYKARAVPKIEIKRVEKGQSIKEIMKSLEQTNGGSCSSDCATSVDLSPEVKTIRDRARELVECATLTRIRQDTCTVVDENHRELPPDVGHHEPVVVEEDSLTKKGWVKEVVNRLQHELPS